MLSIVFFISAFGIFAKLWFYQEWYKLKQPISMTIAGAAAIYGNDYFYFEAFKYAPASHVDLINYLWPILIIIFSGLFTKEKINIYAKLGCFISFFGVYVLIAYDANLPFRQHFLHGYLYAMLDAVIWAGYVVLCRKNKELHSEMIGAYCFIGMVLSMISHIKFETYIAPSFIQWISLISVGIFAQGLAYVLWEMGIKKGDLLLLSTSSYFTPIGSVTLLIFFSKAQYSHTLLVATLLVSLGALMTTKK
jgi:drug/metabolite transporter (DMT)-like permease